ncbi:MAG: hypothetical protein ACTHMM_01255 [Agriterribacter sp.]
MKTFLVLTALIIILTKNLQSQSSYNLITGKSPSGLQNSNIVTQANDFIIDQPTFGLYGIGNVNTEAFQNINSSGKLAGYIRPLKKTNYYLNVNFSFNVNASNNDSLLAGTFLFPDVGVNSFYAMVDYNYKFPSTDDDELHFISPFFEFANKTVKGRKDDSTRYFSTLSYTLGFRYHFLFLNSDDKVSFSVAPFYSVINVPDEDNEDYRYLFTGKEDATLSSSIKSLGIKVAFQYNNFQIFADLRHVLGKERNVAVRELRGFNSNVGVTFNASIFEK